MSRHRVLGKKSGEKHFSRAEKSPRAASPARPAMPVSRLSRLLADAGLRLKKSLGQHFLVNQRVLEKIAAAVEADQNSLVLEIGCGLGNLTQLLAMRAGAVLAVELDERFRTIHEKHLAAFSNLRILYGDFLEADLGALLQGDETADIRVVGNIPYHITSPILFKLMASPVPFRSVCLLMQHEVAQRLSAPPGSRLYGILAAKARVRFEIETVFSVSAGSFQPPPKVRSALVRLTPRAEGSLLPDAERRQDFFHFIDAAFAQRRKFAGKSLAAASGGVLERLGIDQALDALGIARQVRAEQLSTEQLLAFFEELGCPRLPAVRKPCEG